MVSLLSDDEIDQIAAFNIDNTRNLHDPRFGNIGSNEFACPICNKFSDACLGHYASLNLGFKMIHPLIYKHAEELLNSTCWTCGQLLPIVSHIKVHTCQTCNIINPGNYTLSKTDLSIIHTKKDKSTINVIKVPSHVLPKGYIISKILIPPIHLRTPEDMEWPSEFQKLYDNLIHLLRQNKHTTKDICVAYSNIIGLNKQNGITKILSGKDGIFRKIMMGKRIENSARAVIVGDPTLELDQVGIPKTVFNTIKINVCCTKFNISYLKDLAVQKMLWWDNTNDIVNQFNILPGMNFKRSIVDGDLVLLNRQPSLSRFSLMCFRVKIRKDDFNVLSINPQVTAPFNADFDGDEMNIFMLENFIEMYNLCHLSKCVRADTVKSTVLVPVQDIVTGCYLMSLENTPVSTEVWNDCMIYSENNVQNTEYTTRNILSVFIPDYKYTVITKKDLSDIIYKLNDKALHFIYILQKVVLRWLETYGLSIPLQSLVTDPIYKHKFESSDDFKERCHQKVKEDFKNTNIMHIINSGAKGSVTHMSHMTLALGQQYIQGNHGVFCHGSYLHGLSPDEFFGHQMAAREGVVSTGISTAITGYLNRKVCKIMADVRTQYNDTIADDYGVFEFL